MESNSLCSPGKNPGILKSRELENSNFTKNPGNILKVKLN